MYLQRMSARVGLRLSPPSARAAVFALIMIAMLAAVSFIRAV